MTTTTCSIVSCDQCGASPASERHDARFVLCQVHYESWKGWREGGRAAALLAIGQAVALAQYWGATESTIHEAVRIELAETEGLEHDDAFRLAQVAE